jgi:hypothetical protein
MLRTMHIYKYDESCGLSYIQDHFGLSRNMFDLHLGETK